MARPTTSLIEKSQERPSLDGTIRLEKDKTRPNLSELQELTEARPKSLLLSLSLLSPLARARARARYLLLILFLPSSRKFPQSCPSFKLDAIISETNALGMYRKTRVTRDRRA